MASEAEAILDGISRAIINEQELRRATEPLSITIDPFINSFFPGNDKAFNSLINRCAQLLQTDNNNQKDFAKEFLSSLNRFNGLCKAFYMGKPFNEKVYNKAIFLYYKILRESFINTWNSMMLTNP